jgi:hypothetical protein
MAQPPVEDEQRPREALCQELVVAAAIIDGPEACDTEADHQQRCEERQAHGDGNGHDLLIGGLLFPL